MRWKAFFSPSSRNLPMVLTLTLAAASWLAASCSMAELTRVSDERFPTPDSCSHCHVDIYNEWRQSPHARAFTNPRFCVSTDGYQFQECLGCHAPEPMLSEGEPQTRQADRSLGVTCVSCHLDKGAMVGPLPPTGSARPHPIRVDAAHFDNGILCERCHEGTLAQWRAAAQNGDHDCRECHMPAVTRKLTQATSAISKIFVAAKKTAPEHRHAFSLVPDKLTEEPFTLDVSTADSRVQVTLTNRLPHNLPTGDFGVRIVEITVEGFDREMQPSVVGKWELTSAGNGFLEAGQSRQWSAAIPAGVPNLKIVLARRGGEAVEPIVLLQREVAIP